MSACSTRPHPPASRRRVWDRPQRGLYPTVYHSKRLMQQLAAVGRLALYIDIHGISTKSDTFFYG